MTGSQSLMSESHRLGRALPVSRPELERLPRHERKKLQTRERIFRAALKLFTEQGLAATTVDQITAAADVAKGTFFNYFRSKEQVFAVLIEIQLGKVAETVGEARRGKLGIRQLLRRVFRRVAEEPGRSPRLAGALVAAILGSDVARETVADGLAQGRRVLMEILRVGQEEGQVRGDRRVEAMSLAFQQAVFGTLVVWAIRPQAELASLLDASFEDYWASVAAGRKRERR